MHKPVLFLHMGMFKAASTSLQDMFQKNKATFNASGMGVWTQAHHDSDLKVYVPGASGFEASLFAQGMFHLTSSLLNKSEEAGAPTWARTLARFISRNPGMPAAQVCEIRRSIHESFLSSGMSSLLISSEFFHGAVWNCPSSGYAPQRIFKCLAEVFQDFDVRPFFILRRQDDLIKSAYNQVVKVNMYSGTFQDWYLMIQPMLEPALSYYKLLQTLGTCFGEGQTRYFFMDDIKKDTAQFTNILLNFLGISGPHTCELARANESLSDCALELMRVLNPYIKEDLAKWNVARILSKSKDLVYVADKHDANKAILSKSLEIFREDNRMLFEQGHTSLVSHDISTVRDNWCSASGETY